MNKREMQKAVEETQFIIKTIGKSDVGIQIKGCAMGTIYKMAEALSELIKMECIDIEDLDEIVYFARRFAKEKLEEDKKEMPKCMMAEIKGDLADELMGLLNKVKEGRLDAEDIDFESFMKRAKEQEEDED